MNKALFYQNALFFKKNYLKYFSLMFVVAMALYAFNVLFVASYFDNQDFKIWASVGMWIACPLLLSYMYTYDIMSSTVRKDKNVNFIFSSHISIFNIFLVIVIMASIIAIISFLCSYFILFILIGNMISVINFCYLLLSVISVVLFFISIGLILGIYDKKNIGISFVMLFCCSMIQFSYIHIEDRLLGNFMGTYNPIFNVVSNCSAFILNSSKFSMEPIVVMLIISIIFLSITLFSLNVLMNRKYER